MNHVSELVRHGGDKELFHLLLVSGTSLPSSKRDTRALGGFSPPQLDEAREELVRGLFLLLPEEQL